MICGRCLCEWVYTSNAHCSHFQPLPRPPSRLKMASTIKTLLGKVFSFLLCCRPGDDDHEAPPRLLVIVRSHTFVVHSITSLLIDHDREVPRTSVTRRRRKEGPCVHPLLVPLPPLSPNDGHTLLCVGTLQRNETGRCIDQS
jgi:hypothetical protein